MEHSKNRDLIYQELPDRHIRVLDLFPVSTSDLIQLRLSVVPIENPGKYEALSYVWGSTTAADLRTVKCNGVEIGVTENLFEALTRFRDTTTKTRRMWIDALCINQGSIPERNQQVRMMGEIYQRAKEVLIWVGDANEKFDIQRAFQVARTRNDYAKQVHMLDRLTTGPVALLLPIHDADVLEVISKVKQRYPIPPAPDDWDPRLMGVLARMTTPPQEDSEPCFLYVGSRDIGVDMKAVHLPFAFLSPNWDIKHLRSVAATTSKFPTFDDFLREAIRPAELHLSAEDSVVVWRSMVELVGRPYFQRAWVVQEVILATSARIVCGEHEVDYRDFYNVFGMDQSTGIGITVQNFLLDDMKIFNAEENWHVMQKWASCTIPFTEYLAGLGQDHKVFNQIGYYKVKGSQGYLQDLSLSSLLQDFARQKATDPRDKIFGFLGILKHFSTNPEARSWAQNCVDYSLETEEVYRNAARHIVEAFRQRGPNETLPSIGHILSAFRYRTSPCVEGESDVDLPSWVPNWLSDDCSSFGVTSTMVKETDGLIPYSPRIDGDSLFISGSIVDTVDLLSDPLDYSTYSEEMYQEATLCYRLVDEHHHFTSPYGSRESQIDGFWQTIIADNPVGARPSTDATYHFKQQTPVEKWTAHCREKYQKVRELWGENLRQRPILGPLLGEIRRGKQNNDDHALNHLTEDVSLGRERLETLLAEPEIQWEQYPSRLEIRRHIIVKTRKGYFGLAPPCVQQGDVVSLIAGFPEPVYLRQREGEGHYIVISRGWVHGLMYKDDTFYNNIGENHGVIELR